MALDSTGNTRIVAGPGGAMGTGLMQWVVGKTLDLHLAHALANVTPDDGRGFVINGEFYL